MPKKRASDVLCILFLSLTFIAIIFSHCSHPQETSSHINAMFRLLCKISQAIHLLLNFLIWMPIISYSAGTRSGSFLPNRRPSDDWQSAAHCCSRSPRTTLGPVLSHLGHRSPAAGRFPETHLLMLLYLCYHLPFFFPVSWHLPYLAQHYHYMMAIPFKKG